jgi:hypothetical protein
VINTEEIFLSKRPFPEIIINVNDDSVSEEEGESGIFNYRVEDLIVTANPFFILIRVLMNCK